MSFFPNPAFLYKWFNQSRVFDKRYNFNSEELKEYQDKSFKKIIEYSQKTTLYKDKYKKINIDNINKIEDVKKLPFVSKQDLRDYGTKGTVPSDFNFKKGYKVDTSGSTGKPVSIYRDNDAIITEFAIASRIMKTHNLNPRKTRVTNVGDFSIPNSYDEEVTIRGLYKHMGFLSKIIMKNVQNIYAGEDVKQILKKMDWFKPDFVIAYPSTLIGLMLLRNEGNGVNINPKYIASSGGVLDNYTKKQIENAFDTKIFDFYAGTESGGIGFECLEGNYHVESDLVYIEAIDKNMKNVAPGKPGHLVVTRFFGGGTPIIRYTGMDDIITLKDETCSCGWNTQLLEKVQGRSSDTIVLPDGRFFPPATFTLIPGEVAQDTGVDIIKRFQIIQHKKDNIEILVVINDKFRESVPSVEKILTEIKNRYQKVVGDKVNIEVKEVDKIKQKSSSGISPSSIVISHVDKKDWL